MAISRSSVSTKLGWASGTSDNEQKMERKLLSRFKRKKGRCCKMMYLQVEEV
jgi:hypothetical protein